MKKILLAAMFFVAAGSSAFAMDASKVNFRVKSNFESLFADAKNVKWDAKENYVKATFQYDDETLEAFFGADGELIGQSRKVEMKELPKNAQQKIKKDFGNYTVTDAIEFVKDGDKSYYVSLEYGAKKRILQVSLFGSISLYK